MAKSDPLRDVPITPELMEIVVNLHVFFSDYEKMALWLKLKNPCLGGLSPVQMLRFGREKRLLEFVDQSIDENKLPGGVSSDLPGYRGEKV